MKSLDYWKECLSIAAEECALCIAPDQIEYLAANVENWHENYSLAFYQPSGNDRMREIEREWENKLKALQDDFDKYRDNAESAVKKALRQYGDTQVTIGDHGQVFRHGGRTEQIQ